MSNEQEEKQSVHESEPMLEHKEMDAPAATGDEMIEQDLNDEHKAPSEPGANQSPVGTVQEVQRETMTKRRIKVPTLNRAEMNAKLQAVMPNEQQRSYMNLAHLKTLGGILNVVVIILAAVIFCVAINSGNSEHVRWTSFLSYTAMLVPSGFLLTFVLAPHILQDDRNATALALIELAYYLINTILWFVAIWLMVAQAAQGGYRYGQAIFNVILNIIMTALFAVVTFLKILAWRRKQNPDKTGNAS